MTTATETPPAGLDFSSYCFRATLVDSCTREDDAAPITLAAAVYLGDVKIPDATDPYLHDGRGRFGYYLESGARPDSPPDTKDATHGRETTLWLRVLEENLVVEATHVRIHGVPCLAAPREEWVDAQTDTGLKLTWVPIQLGEVVVTRRGSEHDPGRA